MNLTHPDAGMTLIPLFGVTRGCLCLRAHQQNHGPRKISPTLGTDRAAVAYPPRTLCHFFGSWKEPPERSPSSPLKSAVKLQDDGQHQDVSNCGCHRCIHEISITKMEKVTPGQGVFEKLRDLIKSRRIYNSTSLNTHPTPCLCKTHLVRGSTQKSSPPTDGKAQRDRSKGVTGASSLSNLRSSFESGATRRETQERICPHALRSPRKRLKEAKF